MAPGCAAVGGARPGTLVAAVGPGTTMSTPFKIRLRTGIGRPLDFAHASNRYAVAVTALAGLGTLLWRWATGADDIWGWSFRMALAVFLGWAIGRELDPDDTGSAALASLIVIPLTVLGSPSLWSVVAVLLAVRIAVRTTGISPHVIDGIALVAGAAYLGARAGTWPALATLIVAVGTDRYASPPGPPRTIWFGAAMTVTAIGAALWLADPPPWTEPTIAEWVLLGLATAGGFLAIVNTRTPTGRTDFHDETLSESRLRFGRVLVLFTLVVGVVYLGGPAIGDLGPVWAAIIATTVVHYYRLLQDRAAPRNRRGEPHRPDVPQPPM